MDEKLLKRTRQGVFGQGKIRADLERAQPHAVGKFHDIYYDGENHYYIDGTVLDSGFIPVLMVDTDEDKYYRVTQSGTWLIFPYEEEN